MAKKGKSVRNNHRPLPSDGMLQEAQNGIAAFMDASMDAFLLFDDKLNLVSINPAGERMFGISREAIEGKNILDFAPEIKKTGRYDKYLDVIKTGNPFFAEEIFPHSRLGDMHLSVKAFKMRKGLGMIVNDITERKKVEETLRQREEYFRALMENSLDAVTILNGDGTIRYESPSYERLLGFKPEERVRSSLYERIHPDDMPRVAQLFSEFLSNFGGTLHTEVRAQHKDGSWRHIEAIGQNLLENPIVKGIVVNLRDITERKRMEEELRRLSDAVRMTTESVAITDMRGRILEINEAGLNMYGLSDEADFKGKNPLEAIAPEDRSRALENMAKILETGRVTGIEYHVLRKDGSKILIETSVSLIKGEDGEPKGLVAVARDITERKRMEEALRESEERFRRLVDQAPDIIFRWSADKGLEYCSPVVSEITGYSIEELVADPMLGLELAKGIDEGLAEDYEKAVHKGVSMRYREISFARKDGRKIYLEMRSHAVRDNEGKVVAYEGILRDVTERKIAQERYRLVVENANEAIVVAQDGIVKFINPSTIRILGYSKEEIESRPFIDFIHPDDRAMVLERYRARLRGEEVPPVYSFRVVNKKGETRWVEISAVMVDWEGRPASLNFIADITERKEAEEALKRSEEKLRFYLDNSPDAIYILDANAAFLYGNRAAEKFIGYSREELIGKSFLELSLLPQEDLLKAARLFALSRAGKPTGPDELELIRKDGSRVLLEISTYPTWEEGKLEVIGIARDITERKRAEEEKRKLEEQFRLAGRLAAVGELAAGVAHELNNPLAAIQGYAQFLVSRGDIDAGIRKDVEIIYREALRAGKITQNLLSFARRHEPERRLISINEVIEKTIELHAHQMRVNNIELEVELAPDLPETMADFHQMQQVFVNIMNNAEQAMVEAHNGGKLIVKSEADDGMIRVSFKDDGPGISEENMKRIFDPFFTTKEVGKGTGLGLSICYGIVEAHGGRIYARSKLGEGATFIVEIPIVWEEKKAEGAG